MTALFWIVAAFSFIKMFMTGFPWEWSVYPVLFVMSATGALCCNSR